MEWRKIDANAYSQNPKWVGSVRECARVQVPCLCNPSFRAELINMKKIKLTKNLETIVDDKDYSTLNQWKWCVFIDKAKGKMRNCYAARWPGNAIKKGGLVFMHRVIINAKKGEIVDHINGDGLDNRRCNLRLVTTRENAMNMKKHRANPLSLGNYFDKRIGKYVAQCMTRGKVKRLGDYDT